MPLSDVRLVDAQNNPVAPGERGEAVTAVVALKPGAGLTLEELRAFARDKLARYKIPLRLELVDALPRNPAGKVLKYQLRERITTPPEG